MAGFHRGFRQKIVDEYLNETGNNFFVPAEFLEWLRDRKDHPVYAVFYGKSDEEAAHEYRLSLARQFVAGLRIKVTVTPAMASSLPHIAVQMREPVTIRVPAFVSPVSERRGGGGYVPVDISDGDTSREIYRQAAQSLTTWLERYGDAARLCGADVSAVEAVLGVVTVAGAADVAAEAA